MKNSFLSLLIFITANIYSQTGFYLQPTIEHKWHINSTTPYDITTQQGYVMKIEPINFYDFGLSDFNYGLLCGYQTKKLFFETGWTGDQLGIDFNIIGTACSPFDTTYYVYKSEIKSGALFNKYPFRFGLKLLGKDSVPIGKKMRWQCFLYGGIDYLRVQGTGQFGSSSWGVIINPNHDAIQFEDYESTNFYRGEILKTIGFIFKSYNKKGKNIINFSIHYSHGNREMYYSIPKFTNYDQVVYMGLPVFSKGSGLYINVSKDIYPLNIYRKIAHK
jgi:hypothetical protein